MKIVVALAAFALTATANAAGLGRLTVMSALGQPLLAEIEIVALQPGEEEGLTARLASAEAFAAAGIEVSGALSALRISIERRDKRPLLRLTTAQPVNEPFLDMLVELAWTSGKLVREYTFLLDPPEYRSRPQAIAQTPLPPMPEKPAAPAPQAAPQAEPDAKPAAAAPAPAAEAQPTPAPAVADPAPSAAPSAPAAAAATPEKPAAPGAVTYEVKRGDTLAAIAKQHVRPGVTLNQMLIAIFRANEDAFIRGNVNLVRTGRILNIPDPDAVGTVDREEANRLMKDQYAQFNEYRSRLAAVPTASEAGQQGREVAGRIEPKPEAPKPPATPDQLRLSKTEPAKPGAAPSQAAREDDAAARARAMQEAQSRIAELERNVADQQKLLAMRNQQLAELEKKGPAKPAAEAPKPAAEAPKPAAPAPKPVTEAPKPPAEAAKPPAEAPKPAAEAPKPAAEAPKPVAEAPKPAGEAPKPAAEAPKPAAEAAKPGEEAPKPVAKPAPKPAAKAPPPPEPSILDEFIDNPLYLALLGGLVVLLVGYFIWKLRQKKRAQAKFQDSVLGAASASGTGGASLAEPTAPPTSASSQAASTAPAGMEAEEVDPIAEADVYMAYGRDAQAEEILKEALQKDGSRTNVMGKLLEIYAHRKDTKSFEQTALKLKNLTNGAGPEWEKAAALGRSIDPQNGSYAGGSASAEPPAAAAPASAAAAPMLDFDLGGASQTAASAPDISLDDAAKPQQPSALDFDLGSTQSLKLPPQAAAPDETVIAGDKDGGGLDFNLDLGAEEKKAEPPKPAKAAEPSGGLDFDLNLDTDKPTAQAPSAEPSKIDLSDISLDLGTPDATVMAAKPSSDPKWQEVATKLDLAKAYEEMGDKDGARELLKEVVKDGDAAQRGSAEQLLAKLG